MKQNPTLPQLLSVGVAALTLAACSGEDNRDSVSRDSVTPISGSNAQQSSNAIDDSQSAALRPDRIPLVVGGSVVSHQRYPWMAAIVSAADSNAASGQFCGGSLISDRWVLTAAHCVEQETARSTDVLLGQLDLNKNNGVRIGASRIIIHPDYKAQGYPDLALIELEQSSTAQVISIPSRNHPAPDDGEIATVIGWGQVSETGPYSDKLRETSLPVVDHSTCNRAYNGGIDRDSMVCAGTASGNKDSCYGDSGGPLFVKRNNEYVQAGVVSFGEECGLPGVPGVYARVSSYYDWISAYAPVKAYGAGSDNDNDNDSNENTDNNGETDESVSDNTDPATDTQWTFKGKFKYWFDEVYLPNDYDSIRMDQGVLTVTLSTNSDEPVVVFIDQYDPDFGEWYTVTGELSIDGELTMQLDIEAGEYGFSVLSLGDRGRFTLNATLQ